MQGTDKDRWAVWLHETQVFLNEMAKDRDFTVAELSALHSMGSRLHAVSPPLTLEAGVRQAVTQRKASALPIAPRSSSSAARRCRRDGP